MIHVENHGPLIIATNYWASEYATAGKMFCSVNAGAVRLLLPPSFRPAINAMRAAREVVLSRGPWPEAGVIEAVEIMFDDGSDNPWCAHLTSESFDILPADPPPGREWIISVWIAKKEKPHKSLERPCHWRRVPRVPWLRPWIETINGGY